MLWGRVPWRRGWSPPELLGRTCGRDRRGRRRRRRSADRHDGGSRRRGARAVALRARFQIGTASLEVRGARLGDLAAVVALGRELGLALLPLAREALSLFATKPHGRRR